MKNIGGKFFKFAATARLAPAVAMGVAAMMPVSEMAFAAKASVIEEVIVTAQRRAESLQEVPVAVTAINAEDMELKQVTNVLDLQYQVPNISIATNTGTANGARIFLRGVGEDESRSSADPAVGIYVDGVYVGRQVGALFDLVDLEQIEVLRGPQGTLYGRNSNGGAIKLASKKPGAENSLDVKVTAGSDDRFDAKITGNLALSESTAIRATAMQKTRDGFHKLNPNGAFAGQDKEVGEVDTQAFRLALRHDFNADWSANIAFDYTKDESDPVPDSAAPGNDADNDLFTIEPLPGVTCSAATPAAFLPMGCFLDYGSEVESKGLAINLSGTVGDYSVMFLTGYREMEDELASRIGFPYLQETDQDQLSQEITISSNYDGPFNFVAGLYYFEEDVQLDSVFVFPFSLGVETEAWAAFFQSTYDLTDSLTLTTGVRYTDETKDLDATALLTGASRVESQDFENTTYTLVLKNQFNENLMGYVSVATGFKSGGWSPDCFSSATACFLPVDEEELTSFEVGIRSDLWDDRLRLNATYFFNQYEDLQIAATVPGLGFTRFNVDETEIQGLELEVILRATDNLTINASFGTLDGEYTDLNLSQAGGLTNNGASPGCGGVVSIRCAEGLDLKNAPEWKGNIAFIHTLPLAGGELTSSIDFSFEDKSWSLVANSPAHAEVDVDTLINARFAYAPNDGDWKVALWGRNLSDEEYARAATANSFTQYAAEPLTWGVDLEYSF